MWLPVRGRARPWPWVCPTSPSPPLPKLEVRQWWGSGPQPGRMSCIWGQVTPTGGALAGKEHSHAGGGDEADQGCRNESIFQKGLL